MDPRAVENTGIEGKVFSLEDTLLAGLVSRRRPRLSFFKCIPTKRSGQRRELNPGRLANL